MDKIKVTYLTSAEFLKKIDNYEGNLVIKKGIAYENGVEMFKISKTKKK